MDFAIEPRRLPITPVVDTHTHEGIAILVLLAKDGNRSMVSFNEAIKTTGRNTFS